MKLSKEEIEAQKKSKEEEIQKAKEAVIARKSSISQIIVTTGDIKKDYEIIGPIYFQVSNKGIFSSHLSKLVNKYKENIEELKKSSQLGNQKGSDWGFLYGEFSVGQNDFDKAFFVSVQEIKERAYNLGADAVIGMRQDIDLDTNAFAYFYLQMYGTAVKIKN